MGKVLNKSKLLYNYWGQFTLGLSCFLGKYEDITFVLDYSLHLTNYF